MFLTTTSFDVSATNTIQTGVVSTSSIILGCDIQDTTNTATTTRSCLPSASSCEEVLVVTLVVDANETPLTMTTYEHDALATSVYNFIESFWSGK